MDVGNRSTNLLLFIVILFYCSFSSPIGPPRRHPTSYIVPIPGPQLWSPSPSTAPYHSHLPKQHCLKAPCSSMHCMLSLAGWNCDENSELTFVIHSPNWPANSYCCLLLHPIHDAVIRIIGYCSLSDTHGHAPHLQMQADSSHLMRAAANNNLLCMHKRIVA